MLLPQRKWYANYFLAVPQQVLAAIQVIHAYCSMPYVLAAGRRRQDWAVGRRRRARLGHPTGDGGAAASGQHHRLQQPRRGRRHLLPLLGRAGREAQRRPVGRERRRPLRREFRLSSSQPFVKSLLMNCTCTRCVHMHANPNLFVCVHRRFVSSLGSF